jgi:hypothetical protein
MPEGAERLREANRGVPSLFILRRGVELGYLPGLIGSKLLEESLAAISNTFRRFLLGGLIGSSSSPSSSTCVCVMGAASRVISA